MADGPMFMQFLFFFQTYILTVGVLDYVTVEFATNILILSGLIKTWRCWQGGLGDKSVSKVTLPLLCTRRRSPQNGNYSTVVIPTMTRYYLKEITSKILSTVFVGF